MQKLREKDLTINHEYIDSIHRKHNYFILFTFFGASLVYLSIALAAEEIAALLGTVGSWACFSWYGVFRLWSRGWKHERRFW